MNNSKEQWAKSLKPGDMVCDCRYKHLRIKTIKQEYMAWSGPLWLKRLSCDFDGKVIDWFFNKLFETIEFVCRKLHIRRWSDADVELEDGACCSAMHCLDRVDHSESDHSACEY